MKNIGTVRFILTLLAIYQIASGCFLFYALIGSGIQGLLYKFLFLVPYSFLQVIAGIYLFPKTIKPKYIYLTYTIQAMQIIIIKVFCFGYYLQCGVSIAMGINSLNHFPASIVIVPLSAVSEFGFNFSSDGFQLMVNIIPILIIFGLSLLKKKYSTT